MSVNRLSKEYEDEVEKLVRFVVAHAKDPSKII